MHAVHSRGEGDARSDFDGQFSEWYQGLWSSLADSLALSSESTTVAATEPRLRLTSENKQTTNPVVMSYRAKRPPCWSTRNSFGTVSLLRLAVGPTYRAGVARRNGVPDR